MVVMIVTATMINAMISSASTRSIRNEPPGAKKFRSMRRRDAIVASMAGPGPPYQAEIATAGTKNKKLGVGPSRRRIRVATSAIAVTISVSAYRASDVRRFSDRWLDPNNVRPGKHDSDCGVAWRSDFNSEYVAAEGSVDGAGKQKHTIDSPLRVHVCGFCLWRR